MSNPSNLVPFPLGVAEKLRLRQEDLITPEDLQAMLNDPAFEHVHDELGEFLEVWALADYIASNANALFGPQASEQLGDKTIIQTN